MNSGRGVWFEGGVGRVGERRGRGREDIVWLYKKKHEKKGKVDREKDNEIEKNGMEERLQMLRYGDRKRKKV